VAGDSCALVFSCDTPLAVVVVDLTPGGDRIAAVYSVTDPEKLTGIRWERRPPQVTSVGCGEPVGHPRSSPTGRRFLAPVRKVNL
jgi:hypothetical protein